MKQLTILLTLAALLLTSACSTTEPILAPADNLQQQNAASARVVNIRKVTLDADWQHQLVGSALGLAVGEAVGDDAVGMAGLFIGGDIANEMYGKTVDEITLRDKNGNEYSALVPEKVFLLQDHVYFTHANGKLTAVQRIDQ